MDLDETGIDNLLPASVKQKKVDAAKRGLARVSSVEPKSVSYVRKHLVSYVHDPILWGKDVLGFVPDPQQEPFIREYLKNRFNAAKSGHGTGKSCSLSVISMHFLTTRQFSVVPTTAPSKHQLHDILWKEHAKWIRRSPYLSALLEWTAETVKVRGYGNEWHAIARTARAKSDDKSNVGLQGFHAGPHSGGLLYIIDEASGVDESSMNAVEGALSEPDVYVAMGGNPTHLHGTFYNAFHKDSHLWPGLHTLSCLDSKVVDPGYATRIGEKYGYDSDEYRVKVLGEFPYQETSGLVPMSALMLAFELDPEVDNILQEKYVEGGLDVALSGQNRTVLYLRKGNVVFYKKICPETEEKAIAKWVIERIKRYKIHRLTVDCVGAGSGVFSHLCDMGYKKTCIAFKSGSKPIGHNKYLGHDEDQEFLNIRAQAYWYVRRLFIHQQIALAYAKDDEDIREQLATIQVERSTNGRTIQIESKEKMRKRGMKSPDESDALVLCFASDLKKQWKETVGTAIMDFTPLKDKSNSGFFGGYVSSGRGDEGSSSLSMRSTSFWGQLGS